jgi:hypothetical protein
MTKIYMEDLIGMNEEQVYQVLKAYQPTVYGIVIPKGHDLYFGGVAGIYHDYLLARYLRLCLSRISKITGYNSPPVSEMGEFLLVSYTHHLRELAGILSFIASGFDEFGMPTRAFLQAVPELTEEEMSMRPYQMYDYDHICEALDKDLSEKTVKMLELQFADKHI